MELLIVTGMSGAGKSHAANALEDMGYYCVDNIPPAIIPSLVDLSYTGDKTLKKIAIVTDIRGGMMFSEIEQVLERLKVKSIDFKIIFLDAADDVLVRRYKENRRKHPLSQESNSIADAVKEERKKLHSIYEIADFVIDTSYISLSQLKQKLSSILLSDVNDTLSIEFKSFGFKYGADTEADIVIDVRCLPNPFYVEELKNKTGIESEIKEYVLSTNESKLFYSKLTDFLSLSLPLYAKEGKSNLVIAFACTGGKHRSVTFAELMNKYFSEKGFNCHTAHRDIYKG